MDYHYARPLAIGGVVALSAAIGTAALVAPTFAEAPTPVSTKNEKVSVEVLTACSMETTNNEHTKTVVANTYDPQIGEDTDFQIYCNDNDGYSVYAIGNSNSEEGNNKLIGSGTAVDENIVTGTAQSGDVSQWAFKLKSNSAGLTITDGYSDFASIPEKWAKVATRTSGTVGIDKKDNLKATYAAYIAGKQKIGTYSGQVKYAMYHPNTAGPEKTIETLGSMQGFKTLSAEDKQKLIAGMVENQQYELTDSRDGKTYYVAKLKDGNVWMTENLDFDLSTGKQLTPDDTDIKANWTPGTATTTGTTWDTSSAGYNKNMSYDPGDKCWNGVISSSSGNLNNNTTACSQHDKSHYHVGNYYSWTAAVAMDNTNSYTADKTDVDQSICPAGWRLSKYDGTGSFNDLKNKTSFTSGTSGTIHKDPYYFVYGGYWNGSSSPVGLYGLYWSSVVYGSSYSYNLYFNYNGNLNPQSANARYDGYSVRCVVR